LKNLYLKNSKDLPSLLDNYPDGEYWVTKETQGYRVSITKPGVKPGCSRDIAISIHYPDGSSKNPTHNSLFSDFKRKVAAEPRTEKAIYKELELVQEGKEPHTKFNQSCGLPTEILLNALKWVWVEEDRNYPAPSKMGRRMSWASYILFHNGNFDVKTPQGEAILSKYEYSDKEIENIRYRSGSRHLR